MDNFLLTLFLLGLFLFIYNYFGYPLVLVIATNLVRKKIKKETKKKGFPGVTILVAAHNEESVIEQKLINFLKLEYPKNKLEIIFGLDNCSDKTLQIIKSYSKKDQRILFKDFKVRQGKPNVINRIRKMASYEYIIMTDANTFFDKDVVSILAAYTGYENFGMVVGRLELSGKKGGSGESVYWRYENYLKGLEADLAGSISINGGVYLVRKDLLPIFQEDDAVDDMVAMFNVYQHRQDVYYESRAKAFEEEEATVISEYRRRRRIARGNWFFYVKHKKTISSSPFRVRFFFYSHKYLRWLSPFILIATALLLLLNGFVGTFNLRILIGFLFVASFILFFGYLLRNSGRGYAKLFRMFYYFFIMNVGLFMGFIDFLKNKRGTVWSK